MHIHISKGQDVQYEWIVGKKDLQTCKERDKRKRLTRTSSCLCSCKCVACWGIFGAFINNVLNIQSASPSSLYFPLQLYKLCIYHNTNEFLIVNQGIIHLLRNAQKQELLSSIFLFTFHLGHIQWKYDQFGSWKWLKLLSVGSMTRRLRFSKTCTLENVRRHLMSGGLTGYTYLDIRHLWKSVQSQHG